MASITISAKQCIAALRLEGFRVIERTPDQVTLLGPERQFVVVPQVLVLSQAILDALLEEANLSPRRFLWLVSEAPTQTDLTTLPPAPDSSP